MVAAKPQGDGVYQPGYELLAAKIRELISSSDLRPGDRLPTEQALATQLGVSRTMVREAVKLLSAAGLVRTRRGSGIFVAVARHPFTTAAINLSMSVEPEQVASLFEFRIGLEMLSTRLATERITLRELQKLEEAVARCRQGAEASQPDLFAEGDTAFHHGIATASRNPFLAESVAMVNRLQDWAVYMVLTGPPGSLLVATEQHEAILAAMRDGQTNAAMAAMQTHIQTVEAAYRQEVRRRLVGDKVST
jgi:DNA-binding FadR family transcriptional regulator